MYHPQKLGLSDPLPFKVRKEYDNLKDTTGSIPSTKEQDSPIKVGSCIRIFQSLLPRLFPLNQDVRPVPTVSSKYFGVPLADILKRDGTPVPKLIKKAIDYLINSGGKLCSVRSLGFFL